MEVIKGRARASRFDERLSLLGLLLDGVTDYLRNVCAEEKAQTELLGALKAVRMDLARPNADAVAALEKQIAEKERLLATGRKAGSLSSDDQYTLYCTIETLNEENNCS